MQSPNAQDRCPLDDALDALLSLDNTSPVRMWPASNTSPVPGLESLPFADALAGPAVLLRQDCNLLYGRLLRRMDPQFTMRHTPPPPPAPSADGVSPGAEAAPIAASATEAKAEAEAAPPAPAAVSDPTFDCEDPVPARAIQVLAAVPGSGETGALNLLLLYAMHLRRAVVFPHPSRADAFCHVSAAGSCAVVEGAAALASLSEQPHPTAFVLAAPHHALSLAAVLSPGAPHTVYLSSDLDALALLPQDLARCHVFPQWTLPQLLALRPESPALRGMPEEAIRVRFAECGGAAGQLVLVPAAVAAERQARSRAALQLARAALEQEGDEPIDVAALVRSALPDCVSLLLAPSVRQDDPALAPTLHWELAPGVSSALLALWARSELTFSEYASVTRRCVSVLPAALFEARVHRMMQQRLEPRQRDSLHKLSANGGAVLRFRGFACASGEGTAAIVDHIEQHVRVPAREGGRFSSRMQDVYTVAPPGCALANAFAITFQDNPKPKPAPEPTPAADGEIPAAVVVAPAVSLKPQTLLLSLLQVTAASSHGVSREAVAHLRTSLEEKYPDVDVKIRFAYLMPHGVKKTKAHQDAPGVKTYLISFGKSNTKAIEKIND